MISFAGNLTLSGIWTYIFYGAHEGEHHTAFTDGTYLIDGIQSTKPWKLAANGTHLVSTWEDNHYFDSTSNNTANSPPYSNETDAPDDEAVADIIGLGGLLNNLADWQQDWAGAGTLADGSSCDGGLRYGTSHLAKAQGATIPTPYFTFTPATQNPDKSWSYGMPIQIWSKADLQAAVPGLMTSLLAYPNRP